MGCDLSFKKCHIKRLLFSLLPLCMAALQRCVSLFYQSICLIQGMNRVRNPDITLLDSSRVDVGLWLPRGREGCLFFIQQRCPLGWW